MKRSSSPLLVRSGQARATIYPTPSRGCPAFTVCWYEGSARKRKSFADLEAAKLHATTTVNSLSRGEAEIVRLSGPERLEYIRAREAVSEFGISLDSATTEYRDARKILGSLSLLEAARHYADHKRVDCPVRTVSQVFDEMVAAKRDAGLSARYVQDLESRLGEFARSFQCPIGSVSGPAIKAWLQAKPVSNRTRNNSRLAIQTLFSFAKAAKYLPQDWNEMEAVPVWKTVFEEIEVFTPKEMSALLSVVDLKLLPFLVIF